MWDDGTSVVDPLAVPFDLEEDGTYRGTISGATLDLFDEDAFKLSHYYVSPSGELIDTKSKSSTSVLRTYHLDYRPGVEIDFIHV